MLDGRVTILVPLTLKRRDGHTMRVWSMVTFLDGKKLHFDEPSEMNGYAGHDILLGVTLCRRLIYSGFVIDLQWSQF